MNQSRFNVLWLAQFTPVDESLLSENQAAIVAKFRGQFPGAKVGMRDGGRRLSMYLIDDELGPIAADLSTDWKRPG